MSTVDPFQFYPTPRPLAQRAFDKFKQPIRRLLEPSAGRGDLLAPTDVPETEHPRYGRYNQRVVPATKIDCIEIDLTNHPILKAKGYRVVGHDFLKYNGATVYSHLYLNPPFSAGADHVLHAWRFLYSGELVAILNAETVRRANTSARQQLAKLIADHSASPPEFLQEAFLQPETQRQTAVEIVIIHLEKKADFKAEFIDGLAKDATAEANAVDFNLGNEVMLPKTWINNQVTAFTLATRALRESAIADVRAAYYARMLGKSLVESSTDHDSYEGSPQEVAAEKINTGYEKLKEAAWTSVLRSTEVKSRLSSTAQRRLEGDFAAITQLEFTTENIWGFLTGLLDQQGPMQLAMMADLFDTFSKFHDGNACYYQGWKSNNKHRTFGMSIKTSRIVLPACRRDHYSDGFARDLAWDDAQRFQDVDRVMALLDDAKPVEATYGLNNLFRDRMTELRAGMRCSSDYFEARFYRGTGTFHLFPKNKKLIDRLNRLVGKQRAWLPPDDGASVPPGFWTQYEQAEKINKAASFDHVNQWRLHHGDEREKATAHAGMQAALEAAYAKVGISYDPDALLEDGAEVPLLPHREAA